MRWEDREESSNVVDRRGFSGGRAGLGIGGVVLVVAVALLTGQNPLQLLSQVSQQGAPVSGSGKYVGTPREEELKKFTGVVLKDTETVWNEQFAKVGRKYEEPKLVMFSGHVDSGCGMADAGMGPFYCGNDDQVYID